VREEVGYSDAQHIVIPFLVNQKYSAFPTLASSTILSLVITKDAVDV